VGEIAVITISKNDAVIQQIINLLNNFNDAEKSFALNILKQIPERQIDENSYVCAHGYVHGAFNEDTMQAFDECEKLIEQIESGEKVPRYSHFSEILAEIDKEIEDENREKIAV
jgi:hypothetical protein